MQYLAFARSSTPWGAAEAALGYEAADGSHTTIKLEWQASEQLHSVGDRLERALASDPLTRTQARLFFLNNKELDSKCLSIARPSAPMLLPDRLASRCTSVVARMTS